MTRKALLTEIMKLFGELQQSSEELQYSNHYFFVTSGRYWANSAKVWFSKKEGYHCGWLCLCSWKQVSNNLFLANNHLRTCYITLHSMMTKFWSVIAAKFVHYAALLEKFETNFNHWRFSATQLFVLLLKYSMRHSKVNDTTSTWLSSYRLSSKNFLPSFEMLLGCICWLLLGCCSRECSEYCQYWSCSLASAASQTLLHQKQGCCCRVRW